MLFGSIFFEDFYIPGNFFKLFKPQTPLGLLLG